MSQLFSELEITDLLRLHRQSKGPVDPNEELKGLITCLFFANSSTKSRKFTRQLRQFYKVVNSGTSRRIEVIFVPNAKEEQGQGMEEHGNWLYTTHAHQLCKDQCPVCKLQRCYKLQEEPYLVLIHPNGDVLYTGAVEDVRECFRWQCCFHPDSRLGMDTKKAEGTVDYWCWMMDRGNTALVVP